MKQVTLYVQDEAGNAREGVEVDIRIAGTATLQTLYATNDTGGATKANPLTSESGEHKGRVQFFAPDGLYDFVFEPGTDDERTDPDNDIVDTYDLGLRAFLAPSGETLADIPALATRAGKALSFDVDGNPTVTGLDGLIDTVEAVKRANHTGVQAMDTISGLQDELDGKALTATLDALTGVTATDGDLGTFTGTTIADDQPVKPALQALETAVETKTTAATLAATGGATSVGTEEGITVEEALGRIEPLPQFQHLYALMDAGVYPPLDANDIQQRRDVSCLYVADSRGDETTEIIAERVDDLATEYPTHTVYRRFGVNTAGVLSWGSYSLVQTGTGDSTYFADIASISGSAMQFFLGSNLNVLFDDSHGEFALSGGTTSGGAQVTFASTSKIKVGDKITGAGIPSGTRVLNILSTTQVTISKAATATATVSCTFSRNADYDFLDVMQGPNFGFYVSEKGVQDTYHEGLLELMKRAPNAAMVASFGMPWGSKPAFSLRSDAALRRLGREYGFGVISMCKPVLDLGDISSYYNVDGNGELHPNAAGTALSLAFYERAANRTSKVSQVYMQRKSSASENLLPNPRGFEWDDEASAPLGWSLTNCTVVRNPSFTENGPHSMAITVTASGAAEVGIKLPVPKCQGRLMTLVCRQWIPQGTNTTAGRLQLQVNGNDTNSSPGRAENDSDYLLGGGGWRYSVVRKYVDTGAKSVDAILLLASATPDATGETIYVEWLGAFDGVVPLDGGVSGLYPDSVPNFYGANNVVQPPYDPDETLTVTGNNITVTGATAGLARAAINLPNLRVGTTYVMTTTQNSGNGAGVFYARDGFDGLGDNIASAAFSTGGLTFTATAKSMCILMGGATGETAWDIDIDGIAEQVVAAEEYYPKGRYLIPDFFGSISTAPGTPVVNSVRLCRVYVKGPITITDVAMRILTEAAGNMQAAIYAEDATTKKPDGAPLWSSASAATNPGTSELVFETGMSLELSAGYYWLATNTDNTTAKLPSVNLAVHQGVNFGSTTIVSMASVHGSSFASTFGTWPTFSNPTLADVTTSTIPIFGWKLG